jgi:hypothetical protein
MAADEVDLILTYADSMRIIPCPEVTHTLTLKICFFSPHSVLIRSVLMAAIRKISTVETNRLETDVRSARSGMDAVNRHEEPIRVRYHVSFFTTFVLRLEVWHPDSLVTVQSLGNLYSLAPYVDITLPISRRRCSNRGNL